MIEPETSSADVIDPPQGPRTRRTPWARYVAAGVLGVVVALALVWNFRPYEFHGTVLQSQSSAPAMDLAATNGAALDMQAFDGKLVVLYFGYTACPDVCPTTLADVARAKSMTGSDDIQVIMVTVDPDRDTPDRLEAYVESFDPTFLGAYGTDQQIADAAALYGVFYESREVSGASGYLVDHTATLMVIDPDGRLKLLLPFGVSAEDMASDFERLLG